MAHWKLTPQKIEISESDVAKACVQLLRWRHYQPLRVPAGRYIMPDREVLEACRKCGVKPRWQTIAEPGYPDYVIPRFFVEVKRSSGGELSHEQAIKIMDLERTWRLPVAVVKNVDELIQWLAQHDNL